MAEKFTLSIVRPSALEAGELMLTHIPFTVTQAPPDWNQSAEEDIWWIVTGNSDPRVWTFDVEADDE